MAESTSKFPGAVAEIPVADMAEALTYYEQCLGFSVDWGRDGGGIAGIDERARNIPVFGWAKR
jgi:predicted enzyme related to lactoylglutathione lyase